MSRGAAEDLPRTCPWYRRGQMDGSESDEMETEAPEAPDLVPGAEPKALPKTVQRCVLALSPPCAACSSPQHTPEQWC